MKIKHSKYKNTGLIFELLVRQITSDTLRGGDSPAIDILKKYFVKTSLGREYKLYESIIKSKTLTETKANIVVSSILESSRNFNRGSLKKLKYNLISEIKNSYNLEEFFAAKVKNYKELASIYTLIEASNNVTKHLDTNQLISNKVVLLEYLTKNSVDVTEVKKDILSEFETYDKDLRILTYKILLEKFNSKYKNLSIEQKQILKEFINSIDSTPSLRNFYNDKISLYKEALLKGVGNIKDAATRVKITEVSKYLVPLDKNAKVGNENLVDLLQYCVLVEEIKSTNGV